MEKIPLEEKESSTGKGTGDGGIEIYRGVNSLREMCYILERGTVGGFKEQTLLMKMEEFEEVRKRYVGGAVGGALGKGKRWERFESRKKFFEEGDGVELVEYTLDKNTAWKYARPMMVTLRFKSMEVLEKTALKVTRGGEKGVWFVRGQSCASTVMDKKVKVEVKGLEDDEELEDWMKGIYLFNGCDCEEKKSKLRAEWLAMCEGCEKIKAELSKVTGLIQLLNA
ncbi:MAG: hypothetical protein F6K14_27480 [Symploca sp. SIO2C1]|nr:hypothetical protein [Symploca sp. SIO2C1]